jgi:hypothetical protein
MVNKLGTGFIAFLIAFGATLWCGLEAHAAVPTTLWSGKVVASRLVKDKEKTNLTISLLTKGRKRKFIACLRGCKRVPRIAKLEFHNLISKEVTLRTVRVTGQHYVKRIRLVSKIPNADVTPLPAVQLEAPNQVVTGESVELVAQLTSQGPITSPVEFLRDGVSFAQLSSPPYRTRLTVDQPGNSLIQARIRNDRGQESLSNVVTIVSREPKIVLPIEVLGAVDASVAIPVWLSDKNLSEMSDGLTFEAQFFDLNYPDKGKLSVNQKWSVSLNNSTVTMSPRKRAYGGIGGTYSTITLSVVIPKMALALGKNTIRLDYTGTNGFSIGYRVLRFNLKNGGLPIISEERFVYDDPDTWSPPNSSAEAIEAGKKLWSSKTLRSSSLKGATMLRSHCSDCHVDDGYDLKYFNYSNKSIIERAKFHGLTESEGAQIASYIRSLSNVNPGRPWDPPYQPGPGIDSKPVNAWAAGAGIDWVLEDDAQSLPYMFPNGIPKEVDLKRNFNQREIPIPFELPVWNDWLPRVHPIDYWGDKFNEIKITGSFTPSSCYQFASEVLEKVQKVRTPRSDDFTPWRECSGYLMSHGLAQPPASQWSARDNFAKQGVVQWSLVKGWGLLRRFELEGRGALDRAAGFFYFNAPSTGDPVPVRNWPMYGQAFRAAPHILGSDTQGIRDETRLSSDSLTLSWYYLQMIVDSNARFGDGSTHWPYMLAFTGVHAGGFHNGSMRTISLIKMMESYYNNFLPEAGPASGWHGLLFNHVMGDVSPGSINTFSGFTPAEQIAITEMLQRTFLKRTKNYTREQLRAAAPVFFASVPVTDLGPHADTIYFNQRFYQTTKVLAAKNIHGLRIDKALTNEMATFGQYLWPELYNDFQALRR